MCSWVVTAAVLASASTARMSSVPARDILGLPEDTLNDRRRLVIGGGRTLDAVLNRDLPAIVDRHFSQRGRQARLTANYTSPKVLKQIHAYIAALQSPVAGRKQVVGAIVAINGKVESVDVFQATPLFQKLWPKLLKSDALDAFAVNREPAAEKSYTLSDAREFLRTAMQATVQEKSKTEGGLVVTKRESEKVMSFSAGMGGGMSAGGEGAVHSAGYSK